MIGWIVAGIAVPVAVFYFSMFKLSAKKTHDLAAYTVLLMVEDEAFAIQASEIRRWVASDQCPANAVLTLLTATEVLQKSAQAFARNSRSWEILLFRLVKLKPK